jgi:3-deoxy-D-manno-octulosonate 8-phosphate phosphatase (KDO 8-P phosphatase)
MQVVAAFENVRAFFFDMDGVLTDGTLLLAPDQMQLRTMNIKDGFALQLAIKKGYSIFIISGAESQPAKERLQKLGISEVHMNVPHKEKLVCDLLKEKNLSFSEALYMGDDIPDLAVMQRCAMACCPADAVPEVKAIAHFISSKSGGNGCVREIIEKVMRVRGDWEFDSAITSQ